MNEVDHISRNIKGVDVQVTVSMGLSPKPGNEFVTKHENTIVIPYSFLPTARQPYHLLFCFFLILTILPSYPPLVPS